MTHTVSSHVVMADYFPNLRRESRIVRKQWRVVPSIAAQFDVVAGWRKALRGSSEVDVAEDAMAKEAKSLPVLNEVLDSPWEDLPIEKVADLFNPGDLITPQKGDYFFRVPRGTAMTGDGIQEGDLIHFRPQSVCEDEDIAAVRIRTAAGPRIYLKRVKFVENSKKVRLFSMRVAEKEILVDAEKEPFEILAVQKGLIRAN